VLDVVLDVVRGHDDAYVRHGSSFGFVKPARGG
jgi:hypothetical protein